MIEFFFFNQEMCAFVFKMITLQIVQNVQEPDQCKTLNYFCIISIIAIDTVDLYIILYLFHFYYIFNVFFSVVYFFVEPFVLRKV